MLRSPGQSLAGINARVAPESIPFAKSCSRCGLIKPLTQFWYHPACIWKKNAWCAACDNIKRTAHRRRARQRVLEHYSGQSPPCCACCGETTNEFLSIDHINGGGNQERKRLKAWGHQFYEKLIQAGFPPGYQVLCFNCNLAKGFWGRCPHQQDVN